MGEHRRLHLEALDVDEIASALQDQEQYDTVWTLDPRTGDIGYWVRDLSDEDEPNPDLLVIEPLPSWVWYRDMVDFAEGLKDEKAVQRLLRALDGRGAFRRFRNELYEEYPELVPVWQAFRTNRAHCRAVEWLLEHDLIGEGAGREFIANHSAQSPSDG